jgi:hypothetical protein
MGKMKLEDWIQGVLATAMAAIAMGIFMKITWQGWDVFIDWIMKTFGVVSEIEYVLGAVIFVAAVILGLVKLKKFGKKLKLPFLVLPQSCTLIAYGLRDKIYNASKSVMKLMANLKNFLIYVVCFSII